MGARSVGELPQDQKQIYNVRQQKCDKGSTAKEHSDVLYYLMEQSRRCFGDVQFVRDVKAVTEPMCVLATDVQLDDMVRFCTTSDQFAVLCINPTFCIGDFNVIPIVYQHLLLESHRYHTPPIVHGPILALSEKGICKLSLFFYQHLLVCGHS